MLPYLKRSKESGASAPIETIEREHDEEFDELSACAHDMLQAIEDKDMDMLRTALKALCEYIQYADQEQDEEDMR